MSSLPGYHQNPSSWSAPILDTWNSRDLWQQIPMVSEGARSPRDPPLAAPLFINIFVCGFVSCFGSRHWVWLLNCIIATYWSILILFWCFITNEMGFTKFCLFLICITRCHVNMHSNVDILLDFCKTDQTFCVHFFFNNECRIKFPLQLYR